MGGKLREGERVKVEEVREEGVGRRWRVEGGRMDSIQD